MRIVDGSESLGLHIVQETDTSDADDLTEVIDTEKVSSCAIGIIDRGVCTSAKKKSMENKVGIHVEADNVSCRVDAICLSRKRTRHIKLGVGSLRPRQRHGYCQ